MHHKAIVVAVYVGGRVRLELDRHVTHGGVEFEAGPSATVLAQHFGCQVISVIECQQVVLANVESETR